MSKSKCRSCAKAHSTGHFCGYEGTECSEYPGVDFICPEHPFWSGGCDKYTPKKPLEQKIGTMKPSNEPITDLDVAFVAFYNLLYDRIESGCEKGIVISKGNPNQRKVSWKKVMRIAHMIEDFFILRELRTGCKTCEECKHWGPISKTSPHMGACKLHGVSYIHKFHSCEDFKRGII